MAMLAEWQSILFCTALICCADTHQMKALFNERENYLCKEKKREKCKFDSVCIMICKTSSLFYVPLQITYKLHTILALLQKQLLARQVSDCAS